MVRVAVGWETGKQKRGKQETEKGRNPSSETQVKKRDCHLNETKGIVPQGGDFPLIPSETTIKKKEVTAAVRKMPRL